MYEIPGISFKQEGLMETKVTSLGDLHEGPGPASSLEVATFRYRSSRIIGYFEIEGSQAAFDILT